MNPNSTSLSLILPHCIDLSSFCKATISEFPYEKFKRIPFLKVVNEEHVQTHEREFLLLID